MKPLLPVLFLAIMFFSSHSFAKGSEEDTVIDTLDIEKAAVFGDTEAASDRQQDNSDLMIESGSDDSDDSDDEDTDSSSSTSSNSSADQNMTEID
ncbi:MAG TPA: hypothetical protein DCZ80_04285 [Legionellales bacterium]|nr:hypothetical protein [Legionellales bacterium]